MNAPRFPPDAVLQIRKLHRSGMLNVRAWATAYNVSLETVRRIARGDTYREGLTEPAALPAQVILPQTLPAWVEPDPEEVEASFARFITAQEATKQPPSADALLDELQARGRAQPGKPGVSATKLDVPKLDPLDPTTKEQT